MLWCVDIKETPVDLTGSIADVTIPLSTEVLGSYGGGIGSSAIDALVESVFYLPNIVLNIVGAIGYDLGSETNFM